MNTVVESNEVESGDSLFWLDDLSSAIPRGSSSIRWTANVDPSRTELRQGGVHDFEFLWRLQCEAMRPNVERQFGPWDETFQRDLFESSTDPSSHEIIEFNHEAIGCQWVRTHPNAIELVRLHLLPTAQGRGIGTELIQRLLQRAAVARVPVRLQVFRTNPARDLYARLGFRTVGRTDTHESMEHAAQQSVEPGEE